MSELTDVGSARIGTIDNFEIGLQGKNRKKLSLAVDFIQPPEKVSPILRELALHICYGSRSVGTWPATVGQDLISDPGMQAAASGYVQAAYASNGLPATGLLLLPQLL